MIDSLQHYLQQGINDSLCKYICNSNDCCNSNDWLLCNKIFATVIITVANAKVNHYCCKGNQSLLLQIFCCKGNSLQHYCCKYWFPVVNLQINHLQLLQIFCCKGNQSLLLQIFTVDSLYNKIFATVMIDSLCNKICWRESIIPFTTVATKNICNSNESLLLQIFCCNSMMIPFGYLQQ